MGSAQVVGGSPVEIISRENTRSQLMPLPKRRHSKTRGRKRRTHYKMAAPTRSVCPQCREAKQPHRVCPHCGFYKGREVVSIEGA